MKQKEKVFTGGIFALSLLLLAVGIEKLYRNGPLWEMSVRKETMIMAGELILLFGLFVLFFCKKSVGKKEICLSGLVVSIFFWIHQVFFPVLLSGMYVLFLLLLGNGFCRLFLSTGYEKQTPALRWMISFFTGCLLFLLVVCAYSLLGRGSIGELRLFVYLATVFLLIVHVIWIKKEGRTIVIPQPCMEKKQGFCVAILLTMVLLQAGRMNIALDYDSLHYGLRSEFVLNSGKGIYENLGQINVVYTYSKGFESLVLPLSGLSSYSFILSFQLWMTVAVLLVTGLLARRLAGKNAGFLAAAVVSCIPGVMNLAVSAKTDIITLLFQLIFLYLVTEYLEKREHSLLLLAGSTFLFTWILKPTAMVFSAVIFLVTFAFLMVKKSFHLKLKDRWWLIVGLTVLVVAGIWGRTMLLTGVPITSVFTSLFERLGLHLKYPFEYSGIPANGTDISWIESLRHIVLRLWGVIAAPVGEDMAHVIIAWGGGLTLLFPVILLLFCRSKDQYKTDIIRYFNWIALALAVISVVSIHLLWQVDGNYFMLLYVVLTVCGVAGITRLENPVLRRNIKLLLCPVLCFQIAVTMVTNWAGVTGFSPVKLVHGGYFNHREDTRKQLESFGNESIYRMLEADPRQRMLAVGEEPLVLLFPCNVQSYVDVTGSGGNVKLVKTLKDFKGYLSYAGIQSVYVQQGFVKEGSRVYDVITYMIEDGSLTDIKTEYGNLIGKVNLDGRLPADTEENLRIWQEDYY